MLTKGWALRQMYSFSLQLFIYSLNKYSLSAYNANGNGTKSDMFGSSFMKLAVPGTREDRYGRVNFIWNLCYKKTYTHCYVSTCQDLI